MFCFTIWHKNSHMVNQLCFHFRGGGGGGGGGGYKWFVLTPSVVGTGPARCCWSSAAGFRAAPERKFPHLWQRGTPSGLSSARLTAAAGTLRAASKTAPETRPWIKRHQRDKNKSFAAEPAVQTELLQSRFYWGQTVGACRVGRHTFSGLQPRTFNSRWCLGSLTGGHERK